MYIQIDQQQMQSKMVEQVALSSYKVRGQTIENSTATGKNCTNYSAEVKALEQGAKAVDDLTDQTSDVVFLTDSRSALDAIQNQNEPYLIRILNGSLEKRRVVLQWIPVHCGINGNDMADKLAKRGAGMTQHDNPSRWQKKDDH